MQLSLFQTQAGKLTKRKKFLSEIEAFLPINEWLQIINPIYFKSKARTGRPRRELEILLRAFIIKMCFGLSYEKTEDELYESVSVRNFCGVTSDKDIPDATSIFRFETLLTENKMQEQMFSEYVGTLITGGKIIKIGTIVDSTIIDAPKSTKNADKKRDGEAGWTKKAGNYRHGFKGHTGVDDESGLIHSVKFTAANVHDLRAVEDCLHGEEERMEGDSGYLNAENHSKKACKIKRNIMKRRTSVKKMSPSEQEIERRIAQSIASKRAKVEHVYAVIKNIFGWNYTRVRGIKKNAARFFMLCTLANAYKLSRKPKPLKT